MCSFIVLLFFNLVLVSSRWSQIQANQWYSSYTWGAGVNYIPAYADNQIQMWEELNLNEIDKQLSWAKQLGFSKLRVFLHIQPYIHDSTQFLKNIFQFLAVAKSRGHHVILVLFDDCWRSTWTSDRQPEPIPGLHNSQWVQCPGKISIAQQTMKNYVLDVIGTFRNSDTIVLWDVYNQVGNSQKFSASLPLCRKVFEWARQANPSQPLTSGWWNDDKNYELINNFILEQSDVITFHAYCDEECTLSIVKKLKQLDRPLICTQYMARPLNSLFSTHLPMFKREHVWALSWGFVFGRTQTYFPWWSKEGDLVPDIWFCDVLDEDGSPFSKTEAELIKQITQHVQDNLISEQ